MASEIRFITIIAEVPFSHILHFFKSNLLNSHKLVWEEFRGWVSRKCNMSGQVRWVFLGLVKGFGILRMTVRGKSCSLVWVRRKFG